MLVKPCRTFYIASVCRYAPAATWPLGHGTPSFPFRSLRSALSYWKSIVPFSLSIDARTTVTSLYQPSFPILPAICPQLLFSSVLRRSFTFRAAGGVATWVFVFGMQLSYFTPHLAVSVREKAVTETGVSRCRQLAATLPSIGCNVTVNWLQRYRQLTATFPSIDGNGQTPFS